MLKPYWTNGIATLYEADARALPLADKSVHCCVTSPPYWGLRDYGLGQWQGGDAECGHLHPLPENDRPTAGPNRGGATVGQGRRWWKDNTCGHCGAIQQAAGIGLEATLGEWVANIVAVMREVRRVLRDDGTCWLNLGDAYSSGNGGDGGETTPGRGAPQKKRRNADVSLPPKNLMGQPWRVAFALQDDGWILRSAIVWHKPNPMPESVVDRPTSAYEMVFLLAKSGSPTFWTHQDGYGSRTKPAPDYRMVNGKQVNMWRGHDYFYDAEAVREATKPYGGEHTGSANGKQAKALSEGRSEVHSGKGMMSPNYERPTSANARNVWSIPTQGRPDAHFATFPDELPRRCILAGTSERGVCADCGAPWVRVVEKESEQPKGNEQFKAQNTPRNDGDRCHGGGLPKTTTQTLGWQPTCGCNADVVPATVLDCFAGSGTTLAVAQSLGRASVGTDLNREYLDIASKRIGNISLPLPLDLQPTTDYQTSFQEAQEWTTYRTESS